MGGARTAAIAAVSRRSRCRALRADGLRRQNREQSQGQQRTLLAAEAGDQDRRPPRWTGTPAVTPGEQVRRLVGAPMSRCRPGTRQRAARTRPQVRAGQRGPRLGSTARWADGAASRRGRCAQVLPSQRVRPPSSGLQGTPRARGQLSASGFCREAAGAHPAGGPRGKARYSCSCARRHSVGRSCIKIHPSIDSKSTVDIST